MTKTDADALKRLAAFVTQRRQEGLGIRQDQLAYGPSTTTMTVIEGGTERVSDLSYRKLDQSLGWAKGTCLRILDKGEEPVVETLFPPTKLFASDLRAAGNGPRDFEAEMAAIPVIKVDTSARAELRMARKTSPEERTPEQWALIHAAGERADRALVVARRADAEDPFIDLVDEGQRLAAAKDDEDIDAYVRRVESAAVGLMGIDRLMAGLDWRASSRLVSRANDAGVTVQFVDALESLRESGVDGRELTRVMTAKLDEIIADPPPLTVQQQAGLLEPVDFDVAWPPAHTMVVKIDDKLEWALKDDALAEYRLAVADLEPELSSEAGIVAFMELADRMARNAGRDVELEVFHLMGSYGPPELCQELTLTNQGLVFRSQQSDPPTDDSARPSVGDNGEGRPTGSGGPWVDETALDPPRVGDDEERDQSG